jgi:hypothetical protein
MLVPGGAGVLRLVGRGSHDAPYDMVTIAWVCRVVRTDHHALLNGLLLDLVMPILNDADGPRKDYPSCRVQGSLKGRMTAYAQPVIDLLMWCKSLLNDWKWHNLWLMIEIEIEIDNDDWW